VTKHVVSASVALLLVALPAIVGAQKASFDFDTTVTFAQFRTYAWKQGTPAGEYFLDKRIASAIDAQLGAKGLSKNEAAPDLYVLYHVVLGVQRSVSGMGGSYGWRGGFNSIDLRLNELATGTLVIALVSATTQELVWRGIATKEIDIDAKPEKRDEEIAKAVEKILKNYPPKSRG